MSIPPYPSEDLAKLVLGYLAEEQLMTVYDEFLLASPYLDAHVNEYERLNMKSLRSLVSESWSVKIYVEKCKPYSLRKKLLQFSNLLEVFKYLVSNFDVKTIQPCSTNTEKTGARTSHISNVSRSKDLEEECQPRRSPVQENQNDAVPTTSNLVEATSLADLPGNTHHNIRRKHMRVLDKDGPEAARLEAHRGDLEETSSEHHSLASAPPAQGDSGRGHVYGAGFCINHRNEMIGAVNDNPNFISDTRGISTTEGTSQDGLLQTGHNAESVRSIPVSSTSEFRNNLSSTNPDFSSQLNTAAAQKTNPPYLFQVTHPMNLLVQSSDTASNSSKSSDDNKIRILSDVKVDGKTKPCNSNKDLKQTELQMAKFSPMMQTQTIVINGTPAYKGYQARRVTFTRDEIMAMPTMILMPTPGPSTTSSTIATSDPSTTSVPVSSETTAALSLGPLTIDISSSPAPGKPEPDCEPETNTNLVTTVDLKNASVPKDSVITVLGKTSTPQVLPPARKSSSTPRRSSHVRVLDFTTPRRILHETINENPAVEVIVSRSPNLHIPNVPFPESVEPETQAGEEPADKKTDDESSSKENKTAATVKSKSNWDADLRALALASAPPEPKPPVKRVRKKKVPGEVIVETNKKTPRGRMSKKKKRLSAEKAEPPVVTEVKEKAEEKVVVETAVKPTINIITEWKNPAQEAQTETKNKSKEDTSADTPEMDRVSLQNAMGAKLNISDLFETPYKQALYDIQMDTPKFLRPDIPIADEPVSEIKITDIPTPRFLIDTPAYVAKTSQATPSSYSSRPTDYSSGGSYYKPDEQDFIPHPDDLGSPIKYVDTSKPDESKDKSRSRVSSRPVRQCTKNVKYSDVREKTSEKGSDVDVTTVDNSSQTHVDCSSESNGVDRRKDDKKIDTKTKPKADNRRKSSNTSRKRKTPVKKATPKTFMKIKPRRPTPVKENKRKSTVSESLQRKRTSSKEKSSFATPPITPAPTKSRRKSSTPRKLHTKVLTSSSESPENNITTKAVDTGKSTAPTAVDSDTENIPLRWSDDCSLEGKPKEADTSSFTGSEDIMQIKAYLEQSMKNPIEKICEGELGSLHIDLIKRGFDIETAKSIERDLLDSPALGNPGLSNATNVPKEVAQEAKKAEDNDAKEVLDKTVSDSSGLDLVVVQDESEDEEELSYYQCHEGDANYITYTFDEKADHPKREVQTLKENFTIEFCMEDDVIRLQTTSLQVYLDEEPSNVMAVKETEPVTRVDYSSMNTPMKESFHAQCRDLFDSTLASLDTPLKANSPVREESIAEIVLEVEKIEEAKEKTKKRKRASGSSSEDSLVDGKRTKRDASLMRNIDIETVLSKLHGP